MLSFIIPAYNEEALIGATVDAMHHAARSCGSTYEIIVANDASTDRTAEFARQHGARVVDTDKRQIAGTRNAGAHAAQGDVFVFVDADTIVPPETLKAALTALEQGAVGGGCAARFDGVVPLYARTLLPIVTILFRFLRVTGGCFIFCRKEAFEATGGFDESLFATEEMPMCLALKRQGRFIVLREHVITSGRKLRQHHAGEIVGILARLTFTRPSKRARSRDGMGIWYDGLREEPPAAPPIEKQAAETIRGFESTP